MNLRARFHTINLKRSYFFLQLAEETGLNEAQLEILVTLKECPESNTFTEIMRRKDYAKSYVSNAIASLVERGYVVKRSAQGNKKVYNLFLLEKSEEIIQRYYLCVGQFQQEVLKGISESDLNTFQAVLDQMVTNLQDGELPD